MQSVKGNSCLLGILAAGRPLILERCDQPHTTVCAAGHETLASYAAFKNF